MDGAEIGRLLEDLRERVGVDFADYRTQTLAHRVRGFLAAEGLSAVADLRQRLGEEPGVAEALMAALCPRARFFDDPALWQLVRTHIAALLRTYPSIQVWYVGAGSGEGAYTTAMVLREEGLLSRARIYATELHEEALVRGRAAAYSVPEVVAAEPRYVASGGRSSLSEYYAVSDGMAVLRPLFRPHVCFAQHNLATDASFNEFQLILCRGVLGDLSPWLARRAGQLLDASLCRFGFVALDPDDAWDDRGPYERVADGMAVYRKVE